MRLVRKCFLRDFRDISHFTYLPVFKYGDVSPICTFSSSRDILLSVSSSLIGSTGTKTFSPPFSKGLGFCLGDEGYYLGIES
jgi:hypothetical protein